MRIPEDALYWSFDPRSRQPAAEETGTEPVDSLTASQDALARQRSRREKRAQENNAPLRQSAQETPQATEQSQEPEPTERRLSERRKRQQDVLLDTRVTPCRRLAIRPAVDVEA